MTYAIGTRVRTLVGAPAAWSGALAVPAGSEGTITGLAPGGGGGYGVVLDCDPDQLPTSYAPAEITAAT
ncbi:hypothetical protein [Streptomyces fuscigenes]|uniref:hypothetical protein n=1 Tax=Streptomyces fuscigenes TaxID=1528880 RepID=UPI001F490F09|nr:hypothetical protein [Streptomyces fuscigenes]MCF3960290.1 hypothetical protein [Streptomyces fuscigenes]